MENNLAIKIYFAEPYLSWQRDSNENPNSLLSEYFPNKTDSAKVTDKEIETVLL